MNKKNQWVLKVRLRIKRQVNYVFFSVASRSHHVAKRRLRRWLKKEWEVSIPFRSIRSLGRLENKANRRYLRPAWGQAEEVWAIGWYHPQSKPNKL